MTAAAGGASALPRRFPIFPLASTLLLPGGNLPLNMFEPRYVRMTYDAMRTDRVIGMIQPQADGTLYRSGCLGRITSFSETRDNRYLITLTGACRFDIERELDVETDYRQIIADFSRWRDHDTSPPPPAGHLRTPLLAAVRRFFEAHEINADWEQVEAAPLAGLITSLSMICPFEVNEKQALLEAPTFTERGEALIALLTMGAAAPSAEAVRH